MRRLIKCGVLVFGWLTTSFTLAQAQQPDTGEEPSRVAALRQPFERFDGTLLLRARDGTSKALRVVVRNWIIDNRRKIESFPESGFMIVELHSGELTTVIDGNRQERKGGEFWTVPAGATMSVETGNDSAVVQTISIRDTR
jgi:hypothetical protein